MMLQNAINEERSKDQSYYLSNTPLKHSIVIVCAGQEAHWVPVYSNFAFAPRRVAVDKVTKTARPVS